MQLTESKIANTTDTFIYNDEIICITRIQNKKTGHGNFYTYYAEYCTGELNDGQEYAFYYNDLIS